MEDAWYSLICRFKHRNLYKLCKVLVLPFYRYNWETIYCKTLVNNPNFCTQFVSFLMSGFHSSFITYGQRKALHCTILNVLLPLDMSFFVTWIKALQCSSIRPYTLNCCSVVNYWFLRYTFCSVISLSIIFHLVRFLSRRGYWCLHFLLVSSIEVSDFIARSLY